MLYILPIQHKRPVLKNTMKNGSTKRPEYVVLFEMTSVPNFAEAEIVPTMRAHVIEVKRRKSFTWNCTFLPLSSGKVCI